MAECGKKDTCKNYDKKCSECWATSSLYNTHPCYTSKDLVEVVRCKDCKHYKPYAKPVEDFDGECIVRECETDENEFCSYGEKEKEVKWTSQQ